MRATSYSFGHPQIFVYGSHGKKKKIRHLYINIYVNIYKCHTIEKKRSRYFLLVNCFSWLMPWLTAALAHFLCILNLMSAS